MKEYFLEELLQIKNGRDHKHLPEGNIPVYGSGGFMRFVNQAIYSDESILLPRKGTLSNIQFTNKPFWTVDTIYYTIINKEKANPLYLYHYLKQLDLSYLNSGTAVPSMTFGVYYSIKVKIDRSTQFNFNLCYESTNKGTNNYFVLNNFFILHSLQLGYVCTSLRHKSLCLKYECSYSIIWYVQSIRQSIILSYNVSTHA